MSYEPLHHKYRPQTFSQLVGQNAIATTLTSAIETQRIVPAYLFTGPRGTGKTSSARILSKSLNCLASEQPTPNPCGVCEVCRAIANGSALDIVEIDAASNTGVDNIREIIEKAQFAPVQCRHKVYVIDECHMLSTAAFNALLKTLEEPPDRVVFILATTDPQRVLPTIISRCQRFDFRRIALAEMTAHLKYIAEKENIAIEQSAIALVGQIANGGLRDAESLLDQLSLLPSTITVESVWDLVGAVPEQNLLAILTAIEADDSESLLLQCRQLMDRGREPLIVLQNLASFYRDLLIAKTVPNRGDMVALTQPTWEKLCQIAKTETWHKSRILHGQKHLKDSENQIKHTTQPRLWLEVTLLGLLPSAQVIVPTLTATTPKTQLIQSSPHAISEVTPQQKQEPPTSNREPEPKSQIETIPSQSQANPREEISVSTPNPTPISNTGNRIEQIWQKVLGLLQPPTTKALVQQQCCLLNFDVESGIALIGINSQKLYQLHQNKIPNIEAAFEQAWDQKVKVTMKVAKVSEPGKVAKDIPQSEFKQPEANLDPYTPTKQAITHTPEIKQNQHPSPTATYQYQPSIENSQPSSVLVAETSTISTREINTAVKKLADFFKGEIITQGYELYLDQSQLEAEETTTTSEVMTEYDEDMPFFQPVRERSCYTEPYDSWELAVNQSGKCQNGLRDLWRN